MTALINMPRAAWKRQPPSHAAVNWSNPLTQGICVCVSGSQYPVRKPTIYGMGYHNSAPVSSLIPYVPATVNNATILSYEYYGPIVPEWSAAGFIYRDSDIGYPNEKGIVLTSAKMYGRLAIDVRDSGNTNRTILADVFPGNLIPGDRLMRAAVIDNDFLVTSYGNGMSYGTSTGLQGYSYLSPVAGNVFIGPSSDSKHNDTYVLLLARWARCLSAGEIAELYKNPWQLFINTRSRFYLIPSGGGATTYTTTLSIDALIQRAGLTQSTTIDALLQSAFSTSLSLDSLIAAVQSETLSLDALLQIVGTRTVSVDALLQATKSGAVSVDALVQMTLAQNLSLDALIQALQTAGVSLDALLSTAGMQSVVLDALLQSGETGSVSLDGFIQAIQTKTLSLDALLSKSMSAAAVMDALIQSSKTGAVSLDALITGSSATTIFTGLDALIQAIQSKTLSVDALLQKTYTNSLALDAYVALTQVKTLSLDALLQSTKTGLIGLDALIQMTRTVTVSFDALIQAAKTGAISLDAILVFATQASLLLDAYVQKTLSAGVGLDAIIGAIADMVMPAGRVVAVPASDRWVFVTPSDRFIQV